MVLKFCLSKKIRLFLIYGGFIFIIFLFPLSAEKLVILHFNDLHAQIDNLAKIARIIKFERAKADQEVLLISLGDNFSGNPVCDQYQPQGEPLRILFNEIGLDLLVIGNHEFDYGQQRLREFLEGARFPALLGNAVCPEDFRLLLFPLYFHRTRAGIKIIFCPLLQISPEGYPSTNPDHLSGFRFMAPIDFAEKYRGLQTKADLLIALTHLGFEEDRLLAERYDFFPLIIGGHSHTTIERPVKIKNTLIVQAGDNGRFLGRVELEFDDQKRLVRHDCRLIDLREIKEIDERIATEIKKFTDNPVLKRVLLNMNFELKSKESVANLVTDALRAVARAEICLFNGGGIRRSFLKKEITVKDVYDILPFRNDLIVCQLNAKQIRILIGKYFRRNNNRPDLFVSGLVYRIRKKGEDLQIDLRTEDGRPLDETRLYSVVINSYMAATNIAELPAANHNLKVIMGDALLRYLEELARSGKKLPDYNSVKRIFYEES